MARQVSVQFCIDPADRVEPVVNLVDEKFPGRISIQEQAAAILEAQRDNSDLALWSDGSKLESGKVGAAVVWRNTAVDNWKSCKLALGKNKDVLDAELWGVSEALGIALRETAPRKAYKVTVFSDSQTAIRKIQATKSEAGQALRAQIVKRAKEPETSGREVTIRWVPSHSKIEGNELTDKAAKEAAAGGKTGNTQWSSLGYINRNITEARKSAVWSWHRAKNEERESRSRSYYVPRLKHGIHPVLGQAPKKYAARFFQLKMGHAATGVFLERIGRRETAECWWCGRADQSVDHLYTKCRKWRRERRVLKKELRERGIGWQR